MRPGEAFRFRTVARLDGVGDRGVLGDGTQRALSGRINATGANTWAVMRRRVS
ncbi:hypothetical protein FHS23_002542 [Prauserella isguenensis]|uniref:Uncharacterized protein n=1 Tax=Prauserella isguenensis TaxID=1470180 RepID=A0A839S443_9PSEU|nr:hypothetical protein [Prauserella isguenensis]